MRRTKCNAEGHATKGGGGLSRAQTMLVARHEVGGWIAVCHQNYSGANKRLRDCAGNPGAHSDRDEAEQSGHKRRHVEAHYLRGGP